jgi:hypothetical protein|tara:strand:- start:418 stop:552 length:135 start_codon:yes stop_codon:yes gene_type:complete
MDKGNTLYRVVVGSWYKTNVGSIFLDILSFMVVKSTTTTSKEAL